MSTQGAASDSLPVAATAERATAAAVAAAPRVHPARAIFVASIGNALEWFDLIIFGFLSVTLAKQFFPTTDPTVGLLLTLATFGVSFVMRPLGGIVIGAYGDRAGRVKALTVSAGLMMLGTAIIAFVPTYDRIGIAATLAVIFARLVQGFSAGGEFASATAFLAEQSTRSRGFFASWQIASQGLTTLLAAGCGVALSTWLTPAQLDAWGWRLPFSFGMLIGPVALYIRLRMPETPEFQQVKPAKTPLRDTLAHHKRQLLISIGVTALATVSTYLLLFMPTFATRELGLTPRDAFVATTAAGFVQLVLAPVFGHLGDRYGRIPVMTVCAALMLVLIYPLFAWLTASPTAHVALIAQIVFGVLMTGYFACQPALLADLFPTRIRSTGLSLAYNVAVTLFGGFAPLIMTSLVAFTGSLRSPAYYVVTAAVLSLAALLTARAGSRTPAPERPG